MKNFLKSIFTFFFLLCLGFSGCTIDISSDSSDWGYGSGYGLYDSEVLTVFNMTNDFRCNGMPDYWEEGNQTKIQIVGLKPLSLDYDLCRAAQIRACEIVEDFDHTRPDGRDCFTVYDDLGLHYTYKGENIAAGNERGTDTFYQWKEDGKYYEGQGHRRNMLNSNFTHIGIARAYAPGSQYGWYWCMILAKK